MLTHFRLTNLNSRYPSTLRSVKTWEAHGTAGAKEKESNGCHGLGGDSHVASVACLTLALSG